MSQENVEVVRQMYEAFQSGDAEGALDYYHPQVVVDASVRLDAGMGHGRDELNTIVGRWIGAWDDWREEIEELRDLGSQVLVLSTQYGKGKGSGVDVEARYALLYEVQADKITRLTMYDDPAKALAAAGPREY